MDWSRGSAHSISSTLSSSAVARGTIGGLRGQTIGSTIPGDASGGAVCSSVATGFVALDSSASLATPASAPKDPMVPAVALGTVADSYMAGTNCSLPPSLLAVVVDSSSGCQALRDFRTGATSVASTLGSALGYSTVQTGGVRSSVCFELHHIRSSVTRKIKKLQQSNSKTRVLTVWSVGSTS